MSPIMSIAVSAVVRPSRLLLVMVTAVCLCVILIAVLLAGDYFGIASGRQGLLLALTYLVTAISCWSLFFFSQKSYFIAISAAGQIRILELDGLFSETREVSDSNSNSWFVVKLLDDSTLWPKLLLLRLRSESGRLFVLPILPDSVSLQSFRSLSVACRWIAVRIKGNDNQIL